MVHVFSSAHPLPSHHYQQDQYQLFHLQRPFFCKNYELTHHQYQQECQEYDSTSSPSTAEESPWLSPPSLQNESPPPLVYSEDHVNMKGMPLGSCCSYIDTSLTTPSEQQYPVADHFTCRRDSSSSSASSISSSTSSSSSVLSSSYDEDMSAKHAIPVEKCSNSNNTVRASTSRRTYIQRHSTAGSIRPHQCAVCTRTFARRHDLERHTRVHTGIKPYVCPCCLKAFPRSDARGRHFRNEPKCRTGPEVLAFIKKRIRDTI